ncbi:MAG: hypothetical protein ACRD44_11770 [Bryobacteraceae bacterium]
MIRVRALVILLALALAVPAIHAQDAPKSKRGRNALIGALIGAGIGMPVGMATAGYIGDSDRLSTGTRIENGARFGALGAGIGALIGALSARSESRKDVQRAFGR